MPDITDRIDRDTALTKAIELLTDSGALYIAEQAQANAALATAWISLGEALRPTPHPMPGPAPVDPETAKQLLEWTASTIDVVMNNYRNLQARMTTLDSQLRALVQSFEDRSLITEEPALQDAAYMILEILNADRVTVSEA